MNVTKHLPKFLLLLLLLTFTNCQEEELIQQTIEQEVLSPYTINKVSLSQIPNVRDFITTKTKSLTKGKSSFINGAIFDNDNILEVIDTLNNTNYSFRFIFPDTPQNEFYNLVVNQTPEGENQTPYVIKYVCDQEAFSSFASNNYNFSYFSGTMSRYKYTDFFEQDSFDKTAGCPPEYDEKGSPLPCNSSSVNGTSSGGGDSNGEGPAGATGTTNSSSSGSSNCVPEIDMVYVGDSYSLACNCQIAVYQAVIVGWHCSVKSMSTRDVNDCPDCPSSSNNVGVVSAASPTQQLIQLLGNSLSQDQQEWLSLLEDQTLQINLLNFLLENPTDEAEMFINELINAIANNDFTDFFNQELFAQNPFDVWGRLTDQEKEVIKTNPFKAYKVFKNKTKAEQETVSRFGNNGLNDKSDAFRHAFFQAINSKDVGIGFAGELADAHESETPAIWILEKEMDLQNNEYGLVIGDENSSSDNQTIANLIYQAVLDGDLVYLSPINLTDPNFWDNSNTPEPNDGSHGITTNTQLIPTDQ